MTMTEYEYQRKTFDKEGGTIDIPDEAVGITTDYFSDFAVVEYLLPVGGGGSDA